MRDWWPVLDAETDQPQYWLVVTWRIEQLQPIAAACSFAALALPLASNLREIGRDLDCFLAAFNASFFAAATALTCCASRCAWRRSYASGSPYQDFGITSKRRGVFHIQHVCLRRLQAGQLLQERQQLCIFSAVRLKPKVNGLAVAYKSIFSFSALILWRFDTLAFEQWQVGNLRHQNRNLQVEFRALKIRNKARRLLRLRPSGNCCSKSR